MIYDAESNLSAAAARLGERAQLYQDQADASDDLFMREYLDNRARMLWEVAEALDPAVSRHHAGKAEP